MCCGEVGDMARVDKGERLRSERELRMTLHDLCLFLRLLSTPMPGDNSWRLSMAKTIHARMVTL